MTQERPRPRGLRETPEFPPDYLETEIPSDDIIEYDLREGVSPFGPPREYEELYQNPEKARMLSEAGKHYSEAHERNTSLAKEHIEERFLLTRGKSDIFFSGQGSAGLLRQSLDLLSLKSNFVYLAPCFPYLVIEAGKRAKEGNEKVLGSAPVSSNLFVSAEEQLEEAKQRRQEQRFLKRGVMWYLCNPRTPQGDIASIEATEDFIAFCAENGDIVLVDEAYGDWDDDENSTIPLTERYQNLIVTRTLSKGFALAGSRIGYAIMSNEMGKEYRRMFEHNPFQTSGQQQIIAEEMLRPDVIKRHFDGLVIAGQTIEEGVRSKTRRIKAELVSELERKGIRHLPTSDKTPIFTILGNTTSFNKRLIEEGIAYAPGEGFRPTHDDISNQHVRVMIPSDEIQIPDLVRKIERAKRRDTVLASPI